MNSASGSANPGDKSILVIGAGGHAKVVIECLRFSGWSVVGCIASEVTDARCAGVPIIGTDEMLPRLRAEGIMSAFCALGSNALRDRIGPGLREMGFEVPWVRGPGTHVSPSVAIGTGAAILPGAVINAESRVGDFAIVNTNANVDHDGIIGRSAHIGPGAALAGEVVVGDRTFIATGCSVIPQRQIGSDTIVGAGSVVVRDLPDGVIAFGNPAKVRRNL